MTELKARLDKLRFLAEELRLSFVLAKAAPDPWNARLVTRHILIRASDFIEHARQLRRLLRPYGSDREFHDAKEAYAGWFDEYFRTARNKLGAHVQDFDFGRRIELWNDIEISKVETFVDGAAQIYDGLAKLNLPDYVPLPPSLVEEADPAWHSALARFQHASSSPRAEFGADPLAMTRPGSLGGSGTTPIHERASQLSLIARWMTWDQTVIDQFGTFPRVRRMFLSRLVTDAVSFADCLITRALPASALQAMSGLDHLLFREAGETSPSLTAFLGGYQFLPTVDRFRSIRDRIGGHLEIDPGQHLQGILAQLDAVDLVDLKAFSKIMRDAFHAACGEQIYLTLYRADGTRIRGGIPMPSDAQVVYDSGAPEMTYPQLVPYHEWTDEQFRKAAIDWLSPDPEKQEAALEAFQTGLSLNRGGGDFSVEECFGNGRRWETYHFSPAHQVLLRELLQPGSAEEVDYLLELLLQAGRGSPRRTAETLIRYIDEGGTFSTSAAFVRALGRVVEWNVPRFSTPLLEAAKPGRPWALRREAILGLYGAFVRDEGLRRINDKETFLKLAVDVEPLIAAVSPLEELELRLGMASVVRDLDLNFRAMQFAAELKPVKERILAIVSEGSAGGRPDDLATAGKLVDADDFVGLVLHLALPSKGADYRSLLELVRDGTIRPAQGEGGGVHLAWCMWLAGEKAAAVSVVTRLIERYPGKASHELMRLEMLTAMGGHRDEIGGDLGRIRRAFHLAPEELNRVRALEAEHGTG